MNVIKAYKNKIDHCLTNDISIVKDVTTLSILTFPSGHRMQGTHRNKKKKQKPRIDMKK